MFENLILVLPGLLVITINAGSSLLINAIMLASSAIILQVLSSRNLTPKSLEKLSRNSNKSDSKKQFISNFRAFMNIATVMSILAVDFNVFPRRLAKAEVHGTGFMDIGVGSFIFSHAVVSPLARGRKPTESRGLWGFFKGMTDCIPICIIGFLRLMSVKASSYQEHVTEYGVHWNFFFTLAFVKVFNFNYLTIIII